MTTALNLKERFKDVDKLKEDLTSLEGKFLYMDELSRKESENFE